MREHRGPRGVRFPEKPFRITEVDRGVPGAAFYATDVKGARELVAWFCDPRATPQVAERVERLTYARLEAGVSYSLGRFEELRVERIEPHELHWDAK